jgi:hypothetical protein
MIISIVIIVTFFTIAFFNIRLGILLLWPMILLYPYGLIGNLLPGGINFNDIYIVFLMIIILIKKNFKIEFYGIAKIVLFIVVMHFFTDILGTIFSLKIVSFKIIGFQLRTLIKSLEYLFISIIIYNSLKDEQDIKNIIYSLLITVFGLCIIAIFQYLNYDFGDYFYNVDRVIEEGHERATGTTKGPWALGGLMAMINLILLTIILNVKGNYKYYIIFLFSLIAVIFSRSRASWLMLAFGYFIIFYKSNRKIYFLSGFLFLALIIYFIFPSLYETISFRVGYTFSFGKGVLDDSSAARIEIWKELFKSIDIWTLIFGKGSYGLKQIFETTPHNGYLAILLYNGVIGIMAYFILFYSYFKKNKKLLNLEQDNLLKSLWHGIFISTIAFFTFNLVTEAYYTFSIMVVLLFFYYLTDVRIKMLET